MSRLPQRAPGAGFTLLELTVALAIFAVLSAMAYGGLRQVLDARQQTERVAERLAGLQGAFRQLKLDLEQAAPRPVRSEYGDPQPALVASGDGEFAVELTTASWRNPAGLPRSTLRRVAYRLHKGVLSRFTWGVLDRAPDTRPEREELLPGVMQIGLRFLDADLKWHSEWPPLATRDGGLQALPLAVEVTLDLEDWGPVLQLFRLPSAMGDDGEQAQGDQGGTDGAQGAGGAGGPEGTQGGSKAALQGTGGAPVTK